MRSVLHAKVTRTPELDVCDEVWLETAVHVFRTAWADREFARQELWRMDCRHPKTGQLLPEGEFFDRYKWLEHG